MHNNAEQIRDCFRQAAECVQHSNAQTDAKVKQQFLLLARLWLLLADRLDLKSSTGWSDKPEAPAAKREAEENLGGNSC
jgi:hypothetical protein